MVNVPLPTACGTCLVLILIDGLKFLICSQKAYLCVEICQFVRHIIEFRGELNEIRVLVAPVVCIQIQMQLRVEIKH